MFILRAKYLLPVPEKAIENGALAIKESKIVAVGKYPDIHRDPPMAGCPVIDLGESVILPGLINSHTHLELTSLHGTIKPTKSFTNWIMKVVRARLSWGEGKLNNSVQNGITMSMESGTTTLADISTTGHAFQKLKCSPLRKTIFHEVIDFNPSTAETTAQGAREKITGFPCDNLLTIGISPHAPYTVSEELYRKCLELSRELNIPICTHIAETKDEIEFLVRGSGSLASLLRAQNMLDESASGGHPPGLLPVEYLNNVGFLKKGRGGVTSPLLIHCNYLSDKEISIIKESGASVVFCPRSHKFFGHENHPFRELLSKGVNVALGTDSLASNSSLSILDEMRFLYEHHPDLKPQQILSMTTINGAMALGLEDKVGRLEEGFEADITVIDVQGSNPPHPPFVKGGNGGIYERLFGQASRNILTIVAGQVCYDRHGVFH
ncbi:MAG: amidohydrolase family protein [Planctomycetes bacterium]|nr:amidohydrolase family protein [Planctomycetota bacterium]